MPAYTRAMEKLIEELKRLPGVGPKSAERIAFHILSAPPGEAQALSEAITQVKSSIGCCRICFNLSEEETCRICQDPVRDRTVLCVVQEPKDVVSVEKTKHFRGLYHCLLGALSPLDGIGPNELKIKELEARLREGGVQEVVIATNLDAEGEATAMFLARLLKSTGVKLTRIAYGIPVGSALDYQDTATISRAMEGRREL